MDRKETTLDLSFHNCAFFGRLQRPGGFPLLPPPQPAAGGPGRGAGGRFLSASPTQMKFPSSMLDWGRRDVSAALCHRARTGLETWGVAAGGSLSAGPTQTFLGRTKEAALPQLEQLSSFTSPFNTLRIRGHWVWYEAFNGVPYLPHAPSLMAAPEAIAAATIPIIAAVGGMLAIRDRRFWAFAVLMLIGIFIGSGVNGPTGRLFGWVWEYVPGFWTLRSPWYKGTALLVLGMAPLAGLGLAALVDLIRPRAERWIRKVARVEVPGHLMTGLLAILLIIPYLGYTSSFVTGQFFVQRGPELSLIHI